MPNNNHTYAYHIQTVENIKENHKRSHSLKYFYLQRSKHKTYNDFFSETMQARRDWFEILKMLRKEKHLSRILYSTKLFFKSEGEILSHTKTKLKFVISRCLVINVKRTQREGKLCRSETLYIKKEHCRKNMRR